MFRVSELRLQYPRKFERVKEYRLKKEKEEERVRREQGRNFTRQRDSLKKEKEQVRDN